MESNLSVTTWTDCSATPPAFLFLPQDAKLTQEYNACWLVTSIFGVYASTVTTARNEFSMAYDAKTLVKRISDLRDMSISDRQIRELYGLKDVSYWTLANARKQLRGLKHFEECVQPYCYRPFDFRFVFYHGAVCERLRSEVMQHMRRTNIALLTHRPQSPSDFTYIYCTNMIGDQCVAANKTGGGGNSFQFPLFLLPPEKVAQRNLHAEAGSRLNITAGFLKALADKLGLLPSAAFGLPNGLTPEDVFQYSYALFHSPSYRRRYRELLKIDFPRLPLTSSRDLLCTLSAIGSELVALHLLESAKLDKAISTYAGPANPEVEMVSWSKNSVWVDKAQTTGFKGVREEVWNFHIGGYQVCEKWLKDRKGRTLSKDDIAHYQKIVVALSETIRLMEKIDEVIDKHGGWPLK
jgi:predicted helicase